MYVRMCTLMNKIIPEACIGIYNRLISDPEMAGKAALKAKGLMVKMVKMKVYMCIYCIR